MQVLRHRAESLLAASRSVVIAGDFNIAPKPIDHCDWHKASAARQAHFCDDRPDREWFLQLLQVEYVSIYTYILCGGKLKERGLYRGKSKGARMCLSF